MDLYIIRHGQAGHYGDPQWPDDSQRPLTPPGKKRFTKIVQQLAARGFRPGIVAASPLARCLQTAEIIAAHTEDEPQVVALDDLAPGGDLDAVLQWTTEQVKRFRQIAWVGHAPDVGRIAAELVNGGEATIRFAKGAAAEIRFHGPPERGRGELRWLATARLLGC